ncbi:hypothetical protein GOP47_0006940 [Adiantum capillus-veneris]|uniref:U-box domain-containing protein n=1 Tax=Adiantum capillus-veneris TaxID=13818 RepID=A0A9D4UZQ1_ADICA|nr:hypothetical protein GOP47_0006940 [Adiantum capillus-veneris]
MCILCVVSRWSRRIVTMLPWLVIPFIITWAFSQLLPPGYRLEVTSTRLACLGVLLTSLGWYELLMPWLSSWRARRSAILRERRLIEAQEAAKWRKEATRRCRNCLTAYKIQSPGCGRFMCTYCGHVSKRPVLEVPPSLTQIGGQGLHKILHSGGQLATGSLFRGSITRNNDTGCWSRPSERKNCWLGEGTCGSENCKAWQSFIKVLQWIGSLCLYPGIILRKVTGAGKSTSESCRGFQKGKDDFLSSHESRSEKARKRANERRQARLERELLEAEEKKQREEVARMVEERRRQREEKLQVEKESEIEAAAEREREIRRVRELERRRKDKVKERTGEHLEAKAEEETHSTDIHVTGCEQADAEKFTKAAESLKTAKISAAIRRDQGSKIKVPIDAQTRLESSKYGGNVKPRLNLTSKSSSVYQKNGTLKNTKVDGHVSTNKIVWGRAPWFNAWAKGSEALKKHCISSNPCFPRNIGHKLDLNVKDGGNFFNNKAVGTKQASFSGTNAGMQPPIAPPSTHTASIHQLFSSPTIFPPLDLAANLAGQSEQALQGTVTASFRPEHTFFEAPACGTFQSCTGISVPSSPAAPVQGSLLSSPQLTVSVDNGALHYMDVSQHSALLASVKFPQTGNSTVIHCSPISPHTVSVSDTAHSDVNTNLSPNSLSRKSNISNFCLEKCDAVSWDLPSVCLEKTDDVNEGTQERLWSIVAPCNSEVHEQVEPAKAKDPDTLQLPHLSTVQSLFDAEFLLPDSLSLSPQKEGSTLQSGSDSVTYPGQLFDRKSLWSDISALNPAVQIWDDADNNQKLPPEFVDCITQEIMKDPVITADGHSYERTAIEKWLKHHDTSPKTGEVLPPPPGGVGVDKTLRPNHILRGQIIEYNEKLAKMQRNAVSWSNTSKDGEYLPTSTLGTSSLHDPP